MTEATDGVVISQVDGVTLENIYVESSKGNNILNVKNAKNLTEMERFMKNWVQKEKF